MVILQQAFASHQAGNLPEAIGLYQKFLEQNTDHAEAWHLLGVACMQMGNMAGALEALGYATRLDGTNAGYLNNLGLAQFYSNDASAARESYELALALAPQSPDTLNNLGMTLQQMGAIEEAVNKFEAALAITPEDPETLHNYGIALRDLGQLGKAGGVLKKCNDISGGIPDTFAALASIQYTFDEFDNAVQSCWSGVRIDPTHYDCHRTFKGLMKAMLRDDEQYDTMKWAIEAAPDHPLVYQNYGRELAQDTAYAEAEPILKRALELDPGLPVAWSALGWALSHLNRHEEAISAYERALDLIPGDAEVLDNYGQCLIRAGRPADAVQVLQNAHKINPRRSGILGSMTIAMVEADDDAVDRFVDYENDVVARALPTPSGYADMDAFNEALHAELEKQHEQGSLPLDQTMRGGTQIPDNLFKAPSGAVLEIKNLITDAVHEFIDGLKADPDHPFLRYINRDFQFAGAWSTILYGAGYDASHIHNEGWLSGVYYVKVPDLPEESWESGEGCIQFGAPPEEFVSAKNRTKRLIRPQQGLMVLFPSYVWHGVQPFTQEGLRHSIAFDII